jgi:hypothetical protein
MSHPVASTLARSVSAAPEIRLIVRTRRRDSSGYGVGMVTSGSCAKFIAKR